MLQKSLEIIGDFVYNYTIKILQFDEDSVKILLNFCKDYHKKGETEASPYV